MLLQIPNVLNKEQVAECRRLIGQTEWADGKVTAGYQSAQVKHNMQLAEDNPVARKLGDVILAALERNPLFMSAALPLKVFPPLFNCYREGQNFGSHIDNAIRQVKGTPHRVRTDLSATLFLSEPDEYDGGELVVEDTYGAHSVKLAAGHMILYPASSIHHVTNVTRGARIAAFFWIQSMVRSDEERTLLFQLDNTIQSILSDLPEHKAGVQLTGIYHNLLRRWGDA
ncbi:MAG TPA: Fe2+-dependent dioxygenase [Rickettsiales bacterium]|nr:Fe2+-dependent dioxygenase [Rickettsiales bacterium]